MVASASRRVVIVGGGRAGRAIAASLPSHHAIVIVDTEPAVIASLRDEGRPWKLIQGDGTSRLVLEQAGVERGCVVIATSASDAVNREVMTVAAASFGVQERVCVLQDPAQADGLASFDVVSRAEAIAGRVVARLGMGATGEGIGLGKGELLQVTVLDGSPAIGRRLREIGARHWLVAAVYRGVELHIPHGDTEIALNDRVLLVGDPETLADVAPFFRGGKPVFPSQYGADLGALPTVRAEGEWLGGVSRAHDAIEVPPEVFGSGETDPAGLSARLDANAIGCLVIPHLRVPWLARAGLTTWWVHVAILAAGRPVLVGRGTFPYKRVLVALKDVTAQREVGIVAFDVARQCGATLKALTVAPPALGGPAAPSVVQAPQQLALLSRLHGLTVEHVTDEGNPVQAIRRLAGEADLVVVGIGPGRNGPLSPNASLFLLHDLPCSVLFVPWKRA